MLEEFKKFISQDSEQEEVSHSDQNKFFDEVSRDTKVSMDLLLFSVEAIKKIARFDQKGPARRLAREIDSLLSPFRAFEEQTGANKMRMEMNLLNKMYLEMRKILSLVLDQKGEITITRGLLESNIPIAINMEYNPLIDAIRITTKREPVSAPPVATGESQE